MHFAVCTRMVCYPISHVTQRCVGGGVNPCSTTEVTIMAPIAKDRFQI
jgi:hypothetical protein